MAEVRRVWGKMQLDTEGGSVKMQLETEGGSVQVSYETRDKIVGTFAGEIGVTKAVLGSEEVTSRFTREIPKEATTRFTFTREIDVPKAEPGTSTPEIGGIKAGLNEEAGGGIGVTNAVLDKHLPKTGEAADAAFMAWMYKFAEGREQPKSKKVVPPATMTKERMPDAYIQSIMKRPMRRIRPLPDSMYQDNPKLREFLLETNARLDYLVDLQHDRRKQQAEKGYAEIGVDYTDGLLKVYILGEVEGN